MKTSSIRWNRLWSMGYNNLIYVQFSTIGAVVSKTALGLQGQTGTSLKIEDLSWTYPTKIVKNQNKMRIAEANGPVWDSRPSSSLSGSRTDVPPSDRRWPSWSWSHSSWIYNYLCYQCLSQLQLRVRIPFMVRCTLYNIVWCNLLVTSDRSVIFSWYSGFLHQ